jgi:N-acetylglucosamine repressor
MKYTHTKSDRDKHIIEAVVRRFGPISRTQIHELTNLRPTTISILVRKLLQKGALVEAGPIDNPMGRKQILLKLNGDCGFVVAVEFDEDRVVAGVLDVELRVRERIDEPTELAEGLDGLLDQLLRCARKVIRKSKVSFNSIFGMGIASPGLVDVRSGTVVTSSTIDFWKQVPLRAAFETEFRIPTIVECNTRAKTLAERTLGAGNKSENLIYVEYGAGIGAGIIVDSHLLYGQGCAAGEFGHIRLAPAGPACKCGSFGCLEALAGTRAVETRIRKALEAGAFSQLLSSADGQAKNITAWMVLTAAKAGDKTCSNIVAEVVNYLGLGLSNLINLFNPAVVVLDKRLEMAGDLLLDQIMQVLWRQALSHTVENLSLRFAKLEQDPGLLGMGLIVLDKHFEIPALHPPRFMIEPIHHAPATPGARKDSGGLKSISHGAPRSQ